MRPPSLLASDAATLTLQPIIGVHLIPSLRDPESSNVPELERVARDYGAAHAAATAYSAPRLAVAAFLALVSHARLVACPIEGGRWLSRSPAPGIVDALARLGQATPPATDPSDRLPPWASELPATLGRGERSLPPFENDLGADGLTPVLGGEAQA